MLKKLLFALTLCGCISGLASAGPNEGGTLILALGEGITYTTDNSGFCETTVTDCENAIVDTSVEGGLVLHAVAAFPTGSSPRLAGITFGLRYDAASGFEFAEYASCGDFELPDGTWPDNFSGTAVTWGAPQMSQLVEVYWFGVYTYATYGSGTLRLDTNPVQGGNFADDSTPAETDPIVDFGSFGFTGTAGELPCPTAAGPVGACCTPISEACNVRSLEACEAEGGVYQGDDTVCDPNPCDGLFSGACCLDDDSCLFGTELDCINAFGDFQGAGTVCSPNPCAPPPTGACCFADGTCDVLTADDCAAGGGVYGGDDTVCDPNPCPQPEGACCFTDGSCQVLTADACAAAGGAYEGNDTSCSPNPCPQPTGACCFTDGNCEVLTQEQCDPTGTRPDQIPPRSTARRGGGVYQGDGTTCDPNPCPQPGACCLDIGCQVVLEEVCSANAGEFQGEGTSCDPDPCAPVTGACCFPDGSCMVMTADACATEGGEYQGDDTVCSPNPCPEPALGACCLQDGLCQVADQALCEIELVGVYQGDGTSCDPNPCPQLGACCLDIGCQVLSEGVCLAASGTYQGDGTSCDPDPCVTPTGACCLQDDSCQVTDQAFCEGELVGVYLGDGTGCDPNPCVEPMGACCSDDGTCEITDEATCLSDFGDYQGDGTNCDPNPCPQPSYLMVTSEPSGASILIDNVDTGEVTPALIRVDPGEYCVGMVLPYHGGCWISDEACIDRLSYVVNEGETVDAHCLFWQASFPVPLAAYPSPDRIDLSPGAVPQDLTFVVTDLSDLDVEDLDTNWIFLNMTRVRNAGIEVPAPWDFMVDGLIRVTIPSDVVIAALDEELLAQESFSTALDLVILTKSGEWAVATVDVDVVTSNASASVPTLEGGFVSQARPNPFAPSVWIEWNNPKAAKTDLVIYDATGRVLRRLVSAEMSAGFHQAQWDGRDGNGTEVPSGVYYYRLSNGSEVLTNKLFKVR